MMPAVSPPVAVDELATLLGVPAADLAPTPNDPDAVRLPGGRMALTRAGARARLLARLGGVATLTSPIGLANLKGGVGKTTVAANLAVRAARLGLNVCLLDLDPQASATLALAGEPPDGTPVFLDVWTQPDSALDGALMTIGEGLWLLPSALDNTLLDGQLGHPAQQKKAVAGVCEALARRGIELVLIDCPPALGTAVISSLCAMRQLVVPVCADAFSLKGLRLICEETAAIADTFALTPPRLRVLFNRHDRRERLHAEVLDGLRRQYPDALLASTLRVSSQYARALAARRSVFDKPRQPVAAADLDACLRELLGLI